MKKIIIIAVAAVLVIVIGIVAFIVISKGKGEKEAKPIDYFETEIGEMYSNTASNADGVNKIVKFSVIIEYTDAELDIMTHKSSIVSNLYAIFRTMSFEDLSKPTGQDRVAEKIRQMVIEELESDEETITNIYFNQFIIQ